MPKRLLLWDIDGTLITTGAAGQRAVIRATAKWFGNDGDLGGVEIAGRTDVGIAHQILEKHREPITEGKVTAFLDLYLKFLEEELPRSKGSVLPGVRQLLEKFAPQPDTALGLLTGNLRRGAQLKLAHFQLWHFFDFGAFADDHHDRNELGAFALEREIDLHVSPRVAASLAEMIERKPQRLVVDLSRVSYIDSSGLAVLIEGMQNVEEYGGKFILAGLQENVRPIFEIARLDQVFIIFPHVDAALAAN